jgi:N-acetylglutamate synthase-like GNAT family acetyltransferase
MINKKNAIVKISPASQKEADFIKKKLLKFNNSQIPFTQKQPYILKNYVIKRKGKIIAGINTTLCYWNILYIGILFVDEKFRKNKLGSFLLQKAENEAKRKGAALAHLDTFDFQAKNFYVKHGYKVFGTLTNCPSGHKRYFLKKTLK